MRCFPKFGPFQLFWMYRGRPNADIFSIILDVSCPHDSVYDNDGSSKIHVSFGSYKFRILKELFGIYYFELQL
jgi:hypothetical protein